MTQKISQEGIKISEIEDKDQKRAYQFCLSIFDEFKWDKSFAYGLENLKEFFSGPEEIFLLAKKGDRIIACAGLKKLSDTEALLKRFFIAKDFRGKGLAELMLEKIKEFAREKNYKTIVLDVFQDNPRAKRFFRRHGFLVFSPAPYESWPESKHPETLEFRRLDL